MTTEKVKETLKSQYHAALAMLREPIATCPDDLWTAGNHPRQFWRLAYHGLFYANLYSEQNEEAMSPWSKERMDLAGLDGEPEDPAPYSREELLEYWQQIDDSIEARVDGLDLESPESGYNWYPNFPKFDHQILSIRHIQEHAGQLRDRILEAGLDPHWIARGRMPTQAS